MSSTGMLRRARPPRFLMLVVVLLTVGVFHGLQCAQESFTAGHHRMGYSAAVPQPQAGMTADPAVLVRSTTAALAGTHGGDSTAMLGVCLSLLATVAVLLLVQRHARLLARLSARRPSQLCEWWAAALPRAPSLLRLCVSRT